MIFNSAGAQGSFSSLNSNVPLANSGTRFPRQFANPNNPLVRPANGPDAEATVPNGPGTESTDSPFDSLPTASGNNTFNGLFVFDTWSNLNGLNATSTPQRMRVKAVRIVLRVWEPKLKLSRQLTIVQDL